MNFCKDIYEPHVTFPDSEKTIRYRDMTPLSSSLVGQRVTHNPQRNRLIDTLKKYRFESALEIGCNVGACIKRVKDDVNPKGKYAGFDFNRESVEEAARRDPDIDYRVLDAEEMLTAYNVGEFDLIFTVAVLMHCGPGLFRSVCADILKMRPKLILHHEPQGAEALMREISKDRILKMAKYDHDPIPSVDNETIIYFQRWHDYVGTYVELGVPREKIQYDPTAPALSQCDQVVVILDDECLIDKQ